MMIEAKWYAQVIDFSGIVLLQALFKQSALESGHRLTSMMILGGNDHLSRAGTHDLVFQPLTLTSTQWLCIGGSVLLSLMLVGLAGLFLERRPLARRMTHQRSALRITLPEADANEAIFNAVSIQHFSWPALWRQAMKQLLASRSVGWWLLMDRQLARTDLKSSEYAFTNHVFMGLIIFQPIRMAGTAKRFSYLADDHQFCRKATFKRDIAGSRLFFNSVSVADLYTAWGHGLAVAKLGVDVTRCGDVAWVCYQDRTVDAIDRNRAVVLCRRGSQRYFTSRNHSNRYSDRCRLSDDWRCKFGWVRASCLVSKLRKAFLPR